MISFTFEQEKGRNFTPAWKIWDWCKENNLEWFNYYGDTKVEYKNMIYSYDHYTITPTADGERVEIFLRRCA